MYDSHYTVSFNYGCPYQYFRTCRTAFSTANAKFFCMTQVSQTLKINWLNYNNSRMKLYRMKFVCLQITNDDSGKMKRWWWYEYDDVYGMGSVADQFLSSSGIGLVTDILNIRFVFDRLPVIILERQNCTRDQPHLSRPFPSFPYVLGWVIVTCLYSM